MRRTVIWFAWILFLSSRGGQKIEVGNETETGQNENACPKGCACAEGLQPQYECASAGGMLVFDVERGSYLRLRCEGDAELRVDLMPTLHVGPVHSVGISECPPPQDSWRNLLQALGTTPPKMLMLQQDSPVNRSQFIGLTELEMLTLTGPANQSLDFLNELPALRRLSLRGGPSVLEAGALGVAKQLERLDLGQSALQELKAPALGGLIALRKLGIWATKLQRLEVSELVVLENLDLTGNQLKQIKLDDLPPSLQHLNIVNNPLERLEGVGGQLRSLYVRGAATGGLNLPLLLAFPNTLVNLTIARAGLAKLPGELLRNQTSLQRLDLSQNSISELDPSLFASLNNLIELNLQENQIKDLPSRLFLGLRSLRVLRLSHNLLRLGGTGDVDVGDVGGYIGVGRSSPLAPLLALEQADLSHNRLVQIQDDWRVVLLRLRTLNLAYNNISELTDADLNWLSDQVEVDLRYNNISTIIISDIEVPGVENSDPDASGPRLLLQHNPLVCDCRLHALLRRLRARTSLSRRLRLPPACTAPPVLAGTAIDQLPLHELQCRVLGAECPKSCNCWARPEARALALECSTSPATWPEPHTLGLQELHVRLEQPPSSLDVLPAQIKTLDLSNLSLAAAPKGEAPTLRLLDLRHNKLKTAPTQLLTANTTRLLLADNPLQCTCTHKDDIQMLVQYKRQVEDWEKVSCDADAGLLRLTAPDRLCAARHRLAMLMSLAALLVVLSVASAVLIHRRWPLLRLWLQAHGYCLPRDIADDASRPYDAFISYSHEDEAWVSGTLVPVLEGAGRRLCLHHRDWAAGEFIPAQIARSVATSRCTVLVLSERSARSSWARAEWRAALAGGRLLVLLLDTAPPAALPPELRAHLAAHTYLRTRDSHFEARLLAALPARKVTPRSPRSGLRSILARIKLAPEKLKDVIT